MSATHEIDLEFEEIISDSEEDEDNKDKIICLDICARHFEVESPVIPLLHTIPNFELDNVKSLDHTSVDLTNEYKGPDIEMQEFEENNTSIPNETDNYKEKCQENSFMINDFSSNDTSLVDESIINSIINKLNTEQKSADLIKQITYINTHSRSLKIQENSESIENISAGFPTAQNISREKTEFENNPIKKCLTQDKDEKENDNIIKTNSPFHEHEKCMNTTNLFKGNASNDILTIENTINNTVDTVDISTTRSVDNLDEKFIQEYSQLSLSNGKIRPEEIYDCSQALFSNSQTLELDTVYNSILKGNENNNIECENSLFETEDCNEVLNVASPSLFSPKRSQNNLFEKDETRSILNMDIHMVNVKDTQSQEKVREDLESENLESCQLTRQNVIPDTAVYLQSNDTFTLHNMEKNVLKEKIFPSFENTMKKESGLNVETKDSKIILPCSLTNLNSNIYEDNIEVESSVYGGGKENLSTMESSPSLLDTHLSSENVPMTSKYPERKCELEHEDNHIEVKTLNFGSFKENLSTTKTSSFLLDTHQYSKNQHMTNGNPEIMSELEHEESAFDYVMNLEPKQVMSRKTLFCNDSTTEHNKVDGLVSRSVKDENQDTLENRRETVKKKLFFKSGLTHCETKFQTPWKAEDLEKPKFPDVFSLREVSGNDTFQKRKDFFKNQPPLVEMKICSHDVLNPQNNICCDINKAKNQINTETVEEPAQNYIDITNKPTGVDEVNISSTIANISDTETNYYITKNCTLENNSKNKECLIKTRNNIGENCKEIEDQNISEVSMEICSDDVLDPKNNSYCAFNNAKDQMNTEKLEEQTTNDIDTNKQTELNPKIISSSEAIIIDTETNYDIGITKNCNLENRIKECMTKTTNSMKENKLTETEKINEESMECSNGYLMKPNESKLVCKRSKEIGPEDLGECGVNDQEIQHENSLIDLEAETSTISNAVPKRKRRRIIHSGTNLRKSLRRQNNTKQKFDDRNYIYFDKCNTEEDTNSKKSHMNLRNQKIHLKDSKRHENQQEVSKKIIQNKGQLSGTKSEVSEKEKHLLDNIENKLSKIDNFIRMKNISERNILRAVMQLKQIRQILQKSETWYNSLYSDVTFGDFRNSMIPPKLMYLTHFCEKLICQADDLHKRKRNVNKKCSQENSEMWYETFQDISAFETTENVNTPPSQTIDSSISSEKISLKLLNKQDTDLSARKNNLRNNIIQNEIEDSKNKYIEYSEGLNKSMENSRGEEEIEYCIEDILSLPNQNGINQVSESGNNKLAFDVENNMVFDETIFSVDETQDIEGIEPQNIDDVRNQRPTIRENNDVNSLQTILENNNLEYVGKQAYHQEQTDSLIITETQYPTIGLDKSPKTITNFLNKKSNHQDKTKNIMFTGTQFSTVSLDLPPLSCPTSKDIDNGVLETVNSKTSKGDRYPNDSTVRNSSQCGPSKTPLSSTNIDSSMNKIKFNEAEYLKWHYTGNEDELSLANTNRIMKKSYESVLNRPVVMKKVFIENQVSNNNITTSNNNVSDKNTDNNFQNALNCSFGVPKKDSSQFLSPHDNNRSFSQNDSQSQSLLKVYSSKFTSETPKLNSIQTTATSVISMNQKQKCSRNEVSNNSKVGNLKQNSQNEIIVSTYSDIRPILRKSTVTQTNATSVNSLNKNWNKKQVISRNEVPNASKAVNLKQNSQNVAIEPMAYSNFTSVLDRPAVMKEVFSENQVSNNNKVPTSSITNNSNTTPMLAQPPVLMKKVYTDNQVSNNNNAVTFHQGFQPTTHFKGIPINNFTTPSPTPSLLATQNICDTNTRHQTTAYINGIPIKISTTQTSAPPLLATENVSVSNTRHQPPSYLNGIPIKLSTTQTSTPLLLATENVSVTNTKHQPTTYLNGIPINISTTQSSTPSLLATENVSVANTKEQRKLAAFPQLIQSGVLNPDKDVLSLHTPEKIIFASLDMQGCITSNGKTYQNPIQWCNDIQNFFKPGEKSKRRFCYKRIYYQGRALYDYSNSYHQGLAAALSGSQETEGKGQQRGPLMTEESSILGGDSGSYLEVMQRSIAPRGDPSMHLELQDCGVLNLSKMKLLLIGDNEVGPISIEPDLQWDDIDKW